MQLVIAINIEPRYTDRVIRATRATRVIRIDIYRERKIEQTN